MRKWYARSNSDSPATGYGNAYRITMHEARHSRSKLRLVNSAATLCANEGSGGSTSTVRSIAGEAQSDSNVAGSAEPGTDPETETHADREMQSAFV